MSERCPNARPDVHCDRCQVRPLSICGSLDKDELEAMGKLSRTLCFAAREPLFLQGAVSNSVYNVTSGMVRLSKLLPDGRRQVVGFALPGDFLGLSESDVNEFSADALNATTACQFSRKAFARLLAEKPHLLQRLLSVASYELSLAQEQIVILGCRTAEEKVAAFLAGMLKRVSRIDGSTVHIQLPMTRLDIADFVGLTIETVSRVFSKLAREKAIVIVPDGVRILDFSRIQALVEN